MIAIKRISTTKEFAALREDWNKLLSVSNADTIFLTWEWAFSWWEEFCRENNKLFVLVVIAHNKIIAIAPLVITKRTFFGFFNIKEINFIGTKTVHGEYFDFIIASHCEKRKVISSIFDYLDNHTSQWDILRLNGIPEKSVNIQCVADIAIDKNYRFTQDFISICPFVVLPGSWGNFIKSIKKRIKKNFEYQKRRLEKHFGLTFELYDPLHVDTDTEEFFTLHENRWAMKELTGAFVDPRKRRFYHSIASRFSKKNWLRLWFLKVDNKAIAALWGFQYGNKFYYLQSGFDPEWSKYSIGQVLLGSVIENAILEGCSEFDFLSGAESYKYEWGARDKKNVKLDISYRSIKTTMFYAMSFIKNKLWK